jgi:hypothetical protein
VAATIPLGALIAIEAQLALVTAVLAGLIALEARGGAAGPVRQGAGSKIS